MYKLFYYIFLLFIPLHSPGQSDLIVSDSAYAQAKKFYTAGNYSEAMRSYKSSENVLRNRYNESKELSERYINSLYGIANTFLIMDNRDSALFYYLKAETTAEKNLGSKSSTYARVE